MRQCWVAIFDLDDTLYPEADFVSSGFRAVAAWAQCHLAIPACEVYAQLASLFQQGVRKHVFNCWLASRGLAEGNLVSEMVEVYRGHEPEIRPFPEVPSLLRSLKQLYLLGLVSDGYVEVQKRKLKALKLAHFFDAVEFSDKWGKEAWKPSPRPFRAVLQRLGCVGGAQAVYVADNPLKDFLGARRAGLTTVWVHRPQGTYADCEPPTLRHRPHAEIRTLDRLPSVLARLI